MFKVGEKVVYPAHGVGEIEAIRSHVISGTEKKFYMLRILETDMKIMIALRRTSTPSTPITNKMALNTTKYSIGIPFGSIIRIPLSVPNVKHKGIDAWTGSDQQWDYVFETCKITKKESTIDTIIRQTFV